MRLQAEGSLDTSGVCVVGQGQRLPQDVGSCEGTEGPTFRGLQAQERTPLAQWTTGREWYLLHTPGLAPPAVTSLSWTLPPTPSCLGRKHCFLVRLDPTRVREGRSQGEGLTAKRLSHPYVRRAGQEWSAEHRRPRTPLRKAAQQGCTPQCTKDMGREGRRHSVSPNSNPSATQPQEGRAPHSPPRDDTGRVLASRVTPQPLSSTTASPDHIHVCPASVS